jgi:hypothetical protein
VVSISVLPSAFTDRACPPLVIKSKGIVDPSDPSTPSN